MFSRVLACLLSVGASWVVWSCNNIPDCDDPNASDLIIEFRDSTNTQSESEFFSSIRDLNSGVVFLENDTLSIINLEVNPNDTSMNFIFEGIDETDTLFISYQRNILLRSENCGPVQRFVNLDILNHSFQDTVVVSTELIRNAINIQIIR